MKIGIPLAMLLLSGGAVASEDVDTFGDYDSSLTFYFYDNSTYGQVSRIRYLPLFTFVNSGRSRLFLGVNSDGILGLHYRARPRPFQEKQDELSRLPFLETYPALDLY